MSDVLPPSYDSIMEDGTYHLLPQDVKDLLPSLANLPESVHEKAHAVIIDAIANGHGNKHLVDEVKALAESALKVDEAFERVRIGLAKVDDNDYKDKDGKPIEKYEPKWTGYQKRWTTLLWESRDVAIKTEAYITDFLNIIIPEVKAIQTEDDMADAKLDLQEFLNRKDPSGERINGRETKDQAQKYSQEFIDLSRDLNAFALTFDKFAKDQKVKLEKDLATKNNEVAKLNLQVTECQAIVAAVGVALAVTVFAVAAGTVACLAGLFVLGPVYAVGVLVVGILAALAEFSTVIAYVVKTGEKQEELRLAKAEVESLKTQLSHLESLKQILVNQRADITDMCSRLDRIGWIWATVHHDASLILTSIENAIGDNSSKKAFKRRLELVKVTYTNLCDSMALYATQVTKP